MAMTELFILADAIGVLLFMMLSHLMRILPNNYFARKREGEIIRGQNHCAAVG